MIFNSTVSLAAHGLIACFVVALGAHGETSAWAEGHLPNPGNIAIGPVYGDKDPRIPESLLYVPSTDAPQGPMGVMMSFTLRAVDLKSGPVPVIIPPEMARKDAATCVATGKIEPYLNKLLAGGYTQELKTAVGNNRQDQVELALHYCRLENGLTTMFPEKYREIDTHPRRLPSGYFPPRLPDPVQGSQENVVIPNETGFVLPEEPPSACKADHLAYLHNGTSAAHAWQSKNCKDCHSEYMERWRGSAHSYAARDISFNLFELFVREGNQLPRNFGAHGIPTNGREPTTQFCNRCHMGGFDLTADPGHQHSPTTLRSPQFENGMGTGTGIVATQAKRDDLGPVSPSSRNFSYQEVSCEENEGVSCVNCHTKKGPASNYDPAKGQLGDGVANVNHVASIETDLGGFGSVLWGPLNPRDINPPHTAHQWGFNRGNHNDVNNTDSSQLCLGCHDVRPSQPDVVAGTSHFRLENLGTEWLKYREEGKRTGKKTYTCIDCHMSNYPYTDPGVFDQGQISNVAQSVRVRHNHGFPGVTTPLITGDGQFPNIDCKNLNSSGLPACREQLRTAMLRRAITETVDPSQNQVTVDQDGKAVLHLSADFYNGGTGHRVPAGFSQEREVWVKVKVTRDDGTVAYRSGYTWRETTPEERQKAADKLGISIDQFNKLVVEDDLASELVVLDYKNRTLRPEHLENYRPENWDGVGQRDRQRAAEQLGISLSDLNRLIHQNHLTAEQIKIGEEYESRLAMQGLSAQQIKDYNSKLGLGDDGLREFRKRRRFNLLAGNYASEQRVLDGPDAEKRDGGQNQGLQIFTNRFYHVDPETGRRERVYSVSDPMANSVDNMRSLEPLKTTNTQYDIPVDPNYKGKYKVEVSLNYRVMPAHFLRPLYLAEQDRAASQHRDPIITEDMYQDKLRTIQMASQTFDVDASVLENERTDVCKNGIYDFTRDQGIRILHGTTISAVPLAAGTRSPQLENACGPAGYLHRLPPTGERCVKDFISRDFLTGADSAPADDSGRMATQAIDQAVQSCDGKDGRFLSEEFRNCLFTTGNLGPLAERASSCGSADLHKVMVLDERLRRTGFSPLPPGCQVDGVPSQGPPQAPSSAQDTSAMDVMKELDKYRATHANDGSDAIFGHLQQTYRATSHRDHELIGQILHRDCGGSATESAGLPDCAIRADREYRDEKLNDAVGRLDESAQDIFHHLSPGQRGSLEDCMDLGDSEGIVCMSRRLKIYHDNEVEYDTPRPEHQ